MFSFTPNKNLTHGPEDSKVRQVAVKNKVGRACPEETALGCVQMAASQQQAEEGSPSSMPELKEP